MTLNERKKLGLVVNPIAGIGGKVGLKGSDGPDIVSRAVELGAAPVSPFRTIEALERITCMKDKIEIITYPHDMGENEARNCSFDPTVIGSITKNRTTSIDTKNAARDMLTHGVHLMLFAGGDGTARDICEVVSDRLVVLGIPAGVKIHSAVFAITPRAAGDLAALYLQGKDTNVREMEVMDIDEDAFRKNRISAKLFGYLKVPFERVMIQNPKAGDTVHEDLALDEIASEIVENMDTDCLYIVGPGTTTKPIMDKLGLKKTLLGVDVIANGKLVISDANESQLLKLVERRRTKIIVTVIGGQGFIFGRGNQQISPRVIRRVGKENILVVATPEKLASLHGSPLLVDTGERDVDEMLRGYIRVVTGYGKAAVYSIK
jgi:predicted polyphosphate/ATP-dependent NAD kinase